MSEAVNGEIDAEGHLPKELREGHQAGVELRVVLVHPELVDEHSELGVVFVVADAP